MSVVTTELNRANKHPFTNGITTAKTNGNIPNEKNAFSFLPLVIPISKRKIARNHHQGNGDGDICAGG